MEDQVSNLLFIELKLCPALSGIDNANMPVIVSVCMRSDNVQVAHHTYLIDFISVVSFFKETAACATKSNLVMYRGRMN